MLLSKISATATLPHHPHQAILLRRVTNGSVIAIAPDSPGGLLLVKPYYVDFAGAGAAIGGRVDQACTAVYAVGDIRLQTALTQRDREDAIHTRMSYAEQLSVILDVPQAAQRARLILEQLSTWLPGNLALTIPAELAAGLAGVLPQTVQQSWPVPQQETSVLLAG